jgi:hypothetical protein
MSAIILYIVLSNAAHPILWLCVTQRLELTSDMDSVPFADEASLNNI